MIADTMVMRVWASTAACMDVEALAHASKIFLKSFIVLVGGRQVPFRRRQKKNKFAHFADPTEGVLAVKVESHQHRSDDRYRQPHLSRQADDEGGDRPKRLPDRSGYGRPKRFRRITARQQRADDRLEPVVKSGGIADLVLDLFENGRVMFRRPGIGGKRL